MLAKASELSKQLEAYYEVAQQKRKVIAFSHCAGCQTPLEFEHTVDAKREFVVESCTCKGCGGQAPQRRFRLQ